MCFGALDLRERLIAKLALVAGMRPGEIFALTWGRLTETYVEIRQRVYRGTIDTPKTEDSNRKQPFPRGCCARSRGGAAWRFLRARMPGCSLPSG